MSKIIILSALIAASTSTASAQIRLNSPVIVADLYDPRDRIVVVSATSFNQALSLPGGAAAPLNRVFDTCKPEHQLPQPPPPYPVGDPIAKLSTCVDCLAAFQQTRFITARGDQVLLFVLYDASVVNPHDIRPVFDETARDSELFATGKALFNLTKTELQPTLACAAFSYTLQHSRSHFKVTIPVPPGAEAPPSASAEASGITLSDGESHSNGGPQEPTPAVSVPAPKGLFTAERKQKVAGGSPAAAASIHSPELTLGPAERWFLSADFSFSKASVKLAETPTPDASALKSKDFFIGLNFALGDLLADREDPIQSRPFWQELLFKIQVTPSTEPWSAWGFAVGLRGYNMKTILWNMDVVHPYVAIDRQAGDSSTRRWRAVFGLGFDPRSISKSTK